MAFTRALLSACFSRLTMVSYREAEQQPVSVRVIYSSSSGEDLWQAGMLHLEAVDIMTSSMCMIRKSLLTPESYFS